MRQEVIRAVSNSFLAFGFILAVVQCLCGIPVQAEACHVPQVEADCCCAGNDGSVSDSPQELPSALQSSTPRFPGPESHAAPPSDRYPEHFGSGLTRIAVYHTAPPRSLSSLYLMNATFLI